MTNPCRSKVNSCLQRYEEFDNRVIRGIRIALPNTADLNVLRSYEYGEVARWLVLR